MWELGPLGHRVNLLQYGVVLTPAVERTFDDHVEKLERITARISLAGEDGGWFNGAVIDVTGGEFQSLYDALILPER